MERFASEEGPRLIRDGGKDGIIHAFTPTAKTLFKLVNEVNNISKQKSRSDQITTALHSPRIQRAVAELKNQLKKVKELAEQITRPPGGLALTVVNPMEVVANGETVIRLTIEGSNFHPGIDGTKVKLDLDNPWK